MENENIRKTKILIKKAIQDDKNIFYDYVGATVDNRYHKKVLYHYRLKVPKYDLIFNLGKHCNKSRELLSLIPLSTQPLPCRENKFQPTLNSSNILGFPNLLVVLVQILDISWKLALKLLFVCWTNLGRAEIYFLYRGKAGCLVELKNSFAKQGDHFNIYSVGIMTKCTFPSKFMKSILVKHLL